MNASLDYALGLWRDWMGNNFGEIRKIWFPAKTPGLEGRRVITEDAWEELEDECESRIVMCVNAAVTNLTPGQRAALERHLGLTAAIRVRDYAGQLDEAKMKVWRYLLANGGFDERR